MLKPQSVKSFMGNIFFTVCGDTVFVSVKYHYVFIYSSKCKLKHRNPLKSKSNKIAYRIVKILSERYPEFR